MSKKNRSVSPSSKPSFMPRQAWLIAVNIGLLLIVIGTALPLFHVTGIVPGILYAAGAAMVLVGRLFAPKHKNASLRVRRLARLEIWVGLIFCTGAFFIFYTPDRMDWLAFTLAGAAVQIYVSLAMPRAQAKDTEYKSGETK